MIIPTNVHSVWTFLWAAIKEKFSNLSQLQKNLYLPQSKEFKAIIYIAIWSVITYDHSFKFSFSLDIPVSSYGGNHFKILLLQAVANRVNAPNDLRYIKLNRKSNSIYCYFTNQWFITDLVCGKKRNIWSHNAAWSIAKHKM